MSLSSHVTTNLDLWVENGLINAEQREAFAQLLDSACSDSEQAGYINGLAEATGNYDDGYDDGYDNGRSERDDYTFDQGYKAALIEHGIEE